MANETQRTTGAIAANSTISLDGVVTAVGTQIAPCQGVMFGVSVVDATGTAQVQGSVDGVLYSQIAVVDRSSTTPGTRLATFPLAAAGMFWAPTVGVNFLRLVIAALTGAAGVIVSRSIPDQSQT